jgi:hypothetical protein
MYCVKVKDKDKDIASYAEGKQDYGKLKPRIKSSVTAAAAPYLTSYCIRQLDM